MQYRAAARTGFTITAVLLTLLLWSSHASPAAGQNSYRLSGAPFYKTFKKDAMQGPVIVHLPIAIDEKTTSEFFYQGRENVLMPLIAAMNHYLDSLDWSPAIDPALLPATGRDAPALFVGSAEAETAPPSAGMLREEHDTYPPMILFLDKPSKAWKKKLAATLDAAGSEYALVCWIGFNEYPKANKGLFQKKVVLGTGYEPEIRFLSAQDKPVEVLQLTGLVIRRDGEVIRAGAEAFLYEDTPFWAQVLAVSTAIDDGEMRQAVGDHRRDDLPGRPLAWQVALRHLLEQLTGRIVS